MNQERDRLPEMSPELLQAFANTFISRWDTYAVQVPQDGSYRRVMDTVAGAFMPLRLSLIERHLRGDAITLGAYVLDEHSQAKYLVFDADTDSGWHSVLTMAEELERAGIASYREQSRRGGHLWLFFEPMSGTDTRRLGRFLAATYQLDEVELYPKQAELRTGPGSLIRLPLGFHRKLTPPKRFSFVDRDGGQLAPTVREQLAIVSRPERVPKRFIEETLALAPVEAPAFLPATLNIRGFSTEMRPDEKVKAAISVPNFVTQFIELDARGRGYCPFHDDARMSFAAYPENWHCFAGCEGQTVIDFYIKWKGYPSLKLARHEWNALLKELLDLLGI